MGCDIHMCLEIKNRDGIWKSAELYKKNEYYDQDADETDEYIKCDVYDERNYSLFAALAGVRDYSPGTNVICEPRGFPSDASKESEGDYTTWEGDAHTPSWVTLAELYEYQANNKTVPHSGLITPEQAENLKNGITPSSWCQGSTRTDMVWAEWTDEHDVMAGLIESIENQVKTVSYIWGLKERANDIRIIFWFDN